MSRCADDSILLCHRGGVQYDGKRFSVLDAMHHLGASLVRVDNGTSLIRVCSLDVLQIQEIVVFVSNIIEAKSALT